MVNINKKGNRKQFHKSLVKRIASYVIYSKLLTRGYYICTLKMNSKDPTNEMVEKDKQPQPAN